MLTYGQLKTGVCKRIASACASSTAFNDLSNAAVRQLMTRGDWWSTVQPVRFCVQCSTIVWPRFVAAVLAMNSCGRPIDVANKWFSFEPFDSWHRQFARCCNLGQGWSSGITGITDGTTAVINNVVAGDLDYVRFYVSRPEDYGKTVTVFGLDNNGQVVITTHPDGTVQEGVVLTLAQPFVQSAFVFSKIFRIVKDVTVGVVRGYLVQNNTGLMNIMGEYQPTETTPEYIRSRLQGGNCACFTQISALVKLQFIPFINDNDVVGIDNEDAIRDMIMSIREKEAGHIQASVALELSAIRELNKELQTRYPDEQFVSNFRPFGTASFNRVTSGFF